MTTAKKTTQTAAKAAQTTAKAAEQATKENIATLHDNVTAFSTTSDQLAKAGSDAVRDFLASSTQELQRNQEKAFSLGREQFEKLTATADKASRSFGEVFSLSKDQLDAVLESSRIATELTKELQEQITTDANELFNENVELSKELLACRNLNELLEVQNRALQSSVTSFFTNSARLTDAWFRLATEVSEPLNAQGNQVVARLNKAFKA